MNYKPSLSIVIPVYNAENTISDLVNQLITDFASEYSLEIILVNDRSQDNSKNVCIDIFNAHQQLVKFYSLAKNVGEHNAVMAGLNQVTGDYAIIMDDDFQNPVSEVRKLVDYAYAHHYDVVYTYYDKKKDPLLKNMGSWFNDKIANIMLDKPKDLYLSSFKILHTSLIKEIIKYNLPYPYVDGLVLRSTDSIGKLMVKHEIRIEGKSGYTFRKLVSLWLNMFTNFSIVPLRIATVMGFIFSGFGFIFGLISVIEWLLNPNLPRGYTTIIFFVSVVSGVQLVSIGMLGEYIGRVFLSQNKKPQFLIREKYAKPNR
jgi:glycosyltransferase involved in cell wall biosynthesis